MREFEHEQEPTLKYQNRKTSMATTAVLENWEPTTILCPKCGGKHTAFNTMCVLTTYPEQYQYICSDCGHRWTGFKAQSIGSMQSWPDLEFENITPIGQMGWICPKCGRVYAPHMDWCTNCNGTYSPNLVYCGTNNGIKTVYDTMTISNTVDGSKINVTQLDVKKDFDLQNIKAGKGLQQSNCHSNTYESFKQQHGE